ncbi:MAG TPA: FtsX-like permease family protein [Blastocatellia bacterium]|nr:FtsX-like permease family protein [Blastocatellia bacterium]
MLLFKQFILRRLAQDYLRSAVTVLGIALGIAVVVAIQMANASSLRGFATAIETVSGRTSVEITAPGPGFDEQLVAGMGWLREYGQASPVIEGDLFARTPDGAGQTLRLLGVDILRDRSLRDYRLLRYLTGGREERRELRAQEFLNLLLDPRSVVLSEKFARRHGVELGGEIELTFGDRAERYAVRGLLKDEGPARALDGNFALMDIAAAQWALGRLGRLDRVDVRLAEGVAVDEAERAIAGRLPEGLRAQRPARRGRQVEKMLEAFHFNLSALSYIALLVGLFLIYNTVSISVITRREEVGTLRALGATRRQVLGLFLAEAAALGLAGCALGLLLAQLLAYGAVRLTATTVNALYIASAAAPQALGAGHVLLAFGVGLPMALLAAAVPALEASRVSPTQAMRGADRLETRYRLRARYLVVPLALFLLAWRCARLGPVAGRPIFGYAAALLIVFGAAFLVPAVLYAVGRAGGRVLARLFKVEGRLANANLAGAIPRIAISVAALAVSLSMMVAIAVMIGSFRETVVYWVGQTLQADLYLRPAGRANVTMDVPVSPEVERAVVAHPLVEAVDRFRNFDVPYEGGLVTLGAGDFSTLLRRGRLLFKDPVDGAAALGGAIGRDEVIISESFAIKHARKVGDRVTLPTPRGPAGFRVAAVYYDYSSDRGVLVMDRGTSVKYFGERPPTSLTIYLRAGADAERARAEILAALGEGYRVLIYTNGSIRDEVLRIFDSTFAITYALEVIAVFVAILGVASTLLTLILERRREIAVLRLLGADRRQVRKMVIIEAALMGGVSQSVGLAVGLLLSLVLIYVINLQSFGWTIQFHLPLGFLAQSSALILLATALSGVYPANRAARLDVGAQVAEE